MEERERRNVEDIVNNLRQLAAPTNRKILKPNRRSTCQCGCSGHDCESSMRKRNSLLSVIDQSEINDEEETLLCNSCDLKDSCTQTSKTIIQLAKIETGDMSPDSLSQSPRDDDYSLDSSGQSNFENFTLDDSRSDHSNTYHHQHRNNGICYSRNVGEASVDQKILEKDEPREYPKSSLVEEFLRKTKSRNVNSPNVCNCGDRAQFLQQKSPLNKFMKDVTRSSPNNKGDFKSRSCVERMPEDSDKAHRQQHTRFMMKNHTGRSPFYCKDEIYASPEPSSKYCPAIFYQNRRSNSFMQPTLASEQKSKLNEVRTVKHLISPIRRGRSSSPRHQAEMYQPKIEHQIPYIDRSVSELSCHVSYVPKGGRKSLIERQACQGKLNSIVPPANFQEDMRRIDMLSLSLPSDDCLNDDREGDCVSVSSENGLSGALLRIQDSDWNVTLKGLAEVTELCRTMDPEIMLPYMIMINQRLIELLKSPRSHVCRTACQAAGHLFESMKDTRGPEFNDIVDILLCKTADANKFIRQDANLALDCMVTHIPTFHAIRAICARAPLHKNQLVRSAAVRLVICAVVIVGPDNILNPANNEFTRKRIFQNMIRFLEDKNLETRKYGERLYKVLSKEPTFDQFLKKYMDKDDLLRMKKTLKFMLGRKH